MIVEILIVMFCFLKIFFNILTKHKNALHLAPICHDAKYSNLFKNKNLEIKEIRKNNKKKTLYK